MNEASCLWVLLESLLLQCFTLHAFSTPIETWIVYFVICVISTLLFFSLTCPSCVFGAAHNHPIIPLPSFLFPHHLSVYNNTSLLFKQSLSSSYHSVWWLCVSSSLHSAPPLPLMVKEHMRLEREEATRLLEEETEVRPCSDKPAVWTQH